MEVVFGRCYLRVWLIRLDAFVVLFLVLGYLVLDEATVDYLFATRDG